MISLSWLLIQRTYLQLRETPLDTCMCVHQVGGGDDDDNDDDDDIDMRCPSCSPTVHILHNKTMFSTHKLTPVHFQVGRAGAPYEGGREAGEVGEMGGPVQGLDGGSEGEVWSGAPHHRWVSLISAITWLAFCKACGQKETGLHSFMIWFTNKQLVKTSR